MWRQSKVVPRCQQRFCDSCGLRVAGCGLRVAVVVVVVAVAVVVVVVTSDFTSMRPAKIRKKSTESLEKHPLTFTDAPRPRYASSVLFVQSALLDVVYCILSV